MKRARPELASGRAGLETFSRLRYSERGTAPHERAAIGANASHNAAQAQEEGIATSGPGTSRRRRLDVVAPLPPPPATRAGCADLGRPCARSCRAHNGIDEEHAGRPYASSPLREPTVRRAAAGCSLDFVGRHPDGAPPELVAEELGVTAARVRQIENRALMKARIATALTAYLDAFPLEAGCTLTTAYPANLDSGAIFVVVSVRVPAMPPQSVTALPRGRWRGHEGK